MFKGLPKVIEKRKKRIGRGYGSGKGGHTVGKGQKGQKTRKKLGVLFEGFKVKKSLIKRLPLRRGKGKNKSKNKPLVVNAELLNIFEEGETITLEKLIKAKIVDEKDAEGGVKILGNGKITKKINVDLPVSKSVLKQIESLGGKVLYRKDK